MATAERIYTESQFLPEEVACQVLDFIIFLKQRHTLVATEKKTCKWPVELPALDTKGWRFDREEANAR